MEFHELYNGTQKIFKKLWSLTLPLSTIFYVHTIVLSPTPRWTKRFLDFASNAHSSSTTNNSECHIYENESNISTNSDEQQQSF